MIENIDERKQRQHELEKEAIGLGLKRAERVVTGEQTQEFVDAFGGDKADFAWKRRRSFFRNIAATETPLLADAIETRRASCGTKSKKIFALMEQCGTNDEIAAIVVKAFCDAIRLGNAEDDAIDYDDNNNTVMTMDTDQQISVAGVVENIADTLCNIHRARNNQEEGKSAKSKKLDSSRKNSPSADLVDLLEKNLEKAALELSSLYLNATGYFTIPYDDSRQPLRLEMTDEALNELTMDTVSNWHTDANSAHERLFKKNLISPRWPPMLVKPRKWISLNRGGYRGDLAAHMTLVKNRRELAGFSSDECPEVFAAVNHLQETPFRINGSIFSAFSCLFRDYTANLQHEYFTDLEHIGRYETLLDLPGGKLAKNKSLFFRLKHWTKFLGIHDEAKYFLDEHFFFVHSCDFRGRIYPKASNLNYQSSDLQRSLLVFSEKKPLSNASARKWLKRHGANCYAEKMANGIGIDKSTFEEREAWVDANEANILKLGRLAKEDDIFDKLPAELEGWWLEADKPWAFLAWAEDWFGYCEWVGQNNNPNDYPSCLPIEVDGSSNGYQHIAALLRSNNVAEMVNMLPLPSPKDIYTDVAEHAGSELEQYKDSTADISQICNEYFDMRSIMQLKRKKTDEEQKAFEHIKKRILVASLKKKLPRKAAKKVIMTYPYSATEFTMAKKLRKERGLFKHWSDEDIEPGYTKKYLRREIQGSSVPLIEYCIAETLASAICDSIKSKFYEVHSILDWFKQIGLNASSVLDDIQWKSPTGFPVLQHYETQERKRITTPGLRITIKENTGITNKQKHGNAFGPNFIHSFDAAHLMMTVNRAHKNGVTSFRMIHDSYATHAADMQKMFEILRNEFICIYEQPHILEELRASIMNQCKDPVDIKAAPMVNDLDISKVRSAQYFFA